MMLSKRPSSGLREENYEHVLMCLICRSLFDDYDHQPKFLPCHHTFCKDCLREYVRQSGDDIECPSCRKIATIPTAGVVALQTNFYVKYIQSLVYGPSGSDGAALECDIHPHAKLQYFCKECFRSVCTKCCDGESECRDHKKCSLTTVTEEYHQKLDSAFAKANTVIERKKVELEAMVKALSEEKDEAMKKIEGTFEQHVHTLTRRATLLKNKVISIYNDHLEKLEANLEDVSTAMTCIVSLKEYHENMIGKGHFLDIPKGISEMDEVYHNIQSRIHANENHIVYEDKHGIEKFKASAKDLGRVRSSRPMLPRSEPEGKDQTARSGSLDAGSPTIVTPSEEFTSPSEYAASGGGGTPGAVGGGGGHSFTTQERLPTDSNNEDNMQQQQRSGRLNANTLPPQQPSENTSKLDINSNTPITVPGVVRPKTLPKTAPKDQVVQNGFLKRCDKRTSNSAQKRLSQSDMSDTRYSLNVPVEQPAKALDPEIENLKKTDKMYHHLVYTSYDEEELLKELKSGKVHLDQRALDDGGPATTGPSGPPGRGMEDSDSWMTVSTESTLSGNSEDPHDQSRV